MLIFLICFLLILILYLINLASSIRQDLKACRILLEQLKQELKSLKNTDITLVANLTNGPQMTHKKST